MWIQFLRPRAITGRLEFSARLVLSSNSGYSKKQVSLVNVNCCAVHHKVCSRHDQCLPNWKGATR